MTDARTADEHLADIRTRDASWTANYAHMHRTDGYGQAAADRRKLLGEIERLNAIQRDFHNLNDVGEIRQLRERVDSLQNMLGEWLQWFGGINDISHRTRRTLDVGDKQCSE